jgi:hypothetical protein
MVERMRLAAGEDSDEEGSAPVPSAAEAGAETDEPKPPGDASAETPFDRAAAAAALEVVAANASSCRQPGDPTGQARVLVTFSPASGRVTQAVVSGKPFQGTATGGCIARMARQVTVPPYSGAYTTVSKTISVR